MARELRTLGFDAVALAGGYNAWRAAYPVEPKAPVTAPTPTRRRTNAPAAQTS